MKKVLLIALSLVVGMAGFGQRVNPANASFSVTCAKPSPVMVKDGAQTPGRQFSIPERKPITPSRNADRNNWADIEEYWAMITNYDLQSNSALGNRIATWPDGTASFVATWDNSWNTSFPNRGTGYNYYDGESIGEEPWERQEPTRSGWPSITACGNGEILASHSAGTDIYYRPTKGQGEWTLVHNYPDITWPRIICSGDNDQYVHLVAANQEYVGDVYSNTIYYARSTDGGQTWSDMIEFPGLDNSIDGDYRNHLSADDYVMASNGNNVAVMFSSYTTEVFYMISHDNGLTWERQIVAPFPVEGVHAISFDDYPEGMEYGMSTSDDSHSIAIDANGVVHVAFGLFRWKPNDSNNYSYWPFQGYGIVYWNSEYVNEQGGHEIPLFGNYSGDVIHADWAEENGGLGYTLFADRIRELADADGNQHLHIFGYIDEDGDGVTNYDTEAYLLNRTWNYRTKGIATMPGISIDERGNLAIIYSVLSETRLHWDNNLPYRSAYVTCRDSHGNWFDEAYNLSDDFMHSYEEVYNTFAAPRVYDGSFWLGYFADDAQGLYMDINENYPSSNGGGLTDNIMYVVKLTPTLEGWEGGYAITARANPTYGGTVTGGGRYEVGETCTLTATANEYGTFLNWTKNGTVVSTSPTYSFTVTESATFVANFEMSSFEITAVADPVEGGYIEGAGYYVYNSYCYLYAHPNEGYTFVNWTVDGEIVSTNLDYGFRVNGPHNTIVAHFAEINNRFVSLEPTNRNVIIETFTGRNCGYDTDAHRMANELAAANPDRVWPINVHGGYYSPTSYPNLNTWAGSEIQSGFNVSFWPAGAINRTTTEAVSRNEWESLTNAQLLETAECNIGGIVEIDPDTRIATITVEVYYTDYPIYGNGFLTIAMLQDSILGSQSDFGNYNPAQWVGDQYAHLHALRDIISESGSPWGDQLPSYTYPGYFYTHTYTYQIPETIGAPNGVEVDLNNIQFLAWVADSYDGTPSNYSKIMNACNLSTFTYPYHWTTNPNQYESNMTVTGVIVLEGEELREANRYELGAFCGEECRGREKLTYVPEFDRYVVFLTLYGNDNDQLTFRLYDYEAEAEVDIECAETITFMTDDNLGSMLDPFVFHFNSAPAEITQTTDFAQGWNWWSTYINTNGYNSLGVLEEALGSNALQIKSQSDFAQYLEIPGYGGYWYGTLDTILSNKQTYLIQNAASCQIEFTGIPVSPADHPITITQGWNWIGFPSSTAISFADAFAGFTPTDGDQVKSQSSFTQYMEIPGYGGIWYGGLEAENLTPGMGLMYKSMGSGSATLVYPNAGRSVEHVTSVDKHWTNDVHAYPGNMTLMAVVELDDVELASDNYELAAFANGECRGSAKLTYVEPLSRYMAFLTIAGDEAADLYFGLYDRTTGMENFESSDLLIYATDASVGSFNEPMVVRFRGTTGINDLESSLQVYPNPVAPGQRISITLPIGSKVRVETVNALGAIVSTETSTKAPASILAPNISGVYTLRITVDGKGTYCRKLVVE